MISVRLGSQIRSRWSRTLLVNMSKHHRYSTIMFCGTRPMIGKQNDRLFCPKAFSSTSTENLMNVIPDPPLPPVPEQVLNALGEPTLSSLGLCSYWPSGWYQSFLETLHVSLDMPWWGAIATTTVIIRLFLFPFMVSQRRSLAAYTKVMPQMTLLQERMTNARLSGDHFEMMRVSKEMQEFMRSGDANPLKSLKLLFIQIPIFLSVFAGIRGMTAIPVPSMTTGGLFWFTDLAAPDPYWLLPLISMSSMLFMIETGTEMSTQAMTPAFRNIMRIFPCFGFFMVMNMPSALLCYWTTSNLISVVQASMFRLPKVRKWLKLPEVPKSSPSLKAKRGFIEGFRETMTNSKLLAELESRERLDAKSWQQAGRGAIPRTYAYDPTKPPTIRTSGTIIDQKSQATVRQKAASGKI